MAKPTLLYDGECGFCSMWIERWRAIRGDRVEYVTWQESGGPPVKPPEHKGFGSLLIERVVEAELGAARFDFRPQGVTCTFEISL